ncbi:MAG: MBL fold metallo-hydrolase [Candidatus Heimdallarchaeota archaeon]
MHELLSHASGDVLEFRWASDLEIFRFPYWAPCYLIDGLLIDTGAPGGNEEYSRFFRNHEITQCALTHSHEDHAGNVHILNKLEIPVYAHKDAITLLAEGFTYPEYRVLTWGSEVRPGKVKAISKKEIKTQEKGYSFSVIPMPGHASDLIAFLEKNKQWVFVADSVMPKYTQIFDFADPTYASGAWIQEDISLIYRSIRNLLIVTRGMKDLQIFTQLSGIQSRSFLQDRLAEIESMHKQAHHLQHNDLTEDEILIRMFDRESFAGVNSNGHLSRKNLVESLLKWPEESWEKRSTNTTRPTD